MEHVEVLVDGLDDGWLWGGGEWWNGGGCRHHLLQDSRSRTLIYFHLSALSTFVGLNSDLFICSCSSMSVSVFLA